MEEHKGNCRICNNENAASAYSNKLGIARTLPGLAFFSGYFCDACLRAAQLGFQFGFDVGQADVKKTEQKDIPENSEQPTV